MGENKIFMVH